MLGREFTKTSGKSANAAVAPACCHVLVKDGITTITIVRAIGPTVLVIPGNDPLTASPGAMPESSGARSRVPRDMRRAPQKPTSVTHAMTVCDTRIAIQFAVVNSRPDVLTAPNRITGRTNDTAVHTEI